MLALAVCSVCMIGCGPTLQFITQTFATLDPGTQSKQEIDNISIEMNLLPDNEYEKAIYKQPINVYSSGGILGSPGMHDIETVISYFDQMTAFDVTIVNNTDHILRMRDSRIVYVDPDSDQPVMALDKQSVADDVESLPSFKPVFEMLSKKYYETKPDWLKEQLSKAMMNITKKIPFVNGFNQEIMPGMRLKGFVVFAIDPKQVAQGKVSFIDMVSETDAAGNPTKKVRFDYRITTLERYWRYNSETDKAWVEIKKEEYDSRPNK
jgi:hypothetical protein